MLQLKSHCMFVKVVQTEEAVFTTKAEANIQYIKSELEALSDGGSLQEIALDPIQVLLILCIRSLDKSGLCF